MANYSTEQQADYSFINVLVFQNWKTIYFAIDAVNVI